MESIQISPWKYDGHWQCSSRGHSNTLFILFTQNKIKPLGIDSNTQRSCLNSQQFFFCQWSQLLGKKTKAKLKNINPSIKYIKIYTALTAEDKYRKYISKSEFLSEFVKKENCVTCWNWDVRIKRLSWIQTRKQINIKTLYVKIYRRILLWYRRLQCVYFNFAEFSCLKKKILNESIATINK